MYILIHNTSFGYVRSNFAKYDTVKDAMLSIPSVCSMLDVPEDQFKIISINYLDCIDLM